MAFAVSMVLAFLWIGQEQPELLVGEALTGVLEQTGPPQREGLGSFAVVPFSAPGTGEFTFTLESYDFDAVLIVRERDGGAELALDDNEGVATDAHLTVPLERGRVYEVIVTTKAGQGGEYVLTVRDGATAALKNEPGIDAAILHLAESARRARDRGDLRTASAKHHARAGLLTDRSRLDDAMDAYEQGHQLAEAGGFAFEAAWSLLGKGITHYRLGDLPRAREIFERVIEIAPEVGDDQLLGSARGSLCSVYGALGNYADAESCYREALEFARRRGLPDRQALYLENVANLRHIAGDVDEALALYEEAYELCREHELATRASSVLSSWGGVFVERRQYDLAEERLEIALSIARQLGDLNSQADATEKLGNLLFVQGKYLLAQERYEEGLALTTTVGDVWREASMLANIGLCAWNTGRLETALARLDEALLKARRVGEAGLEFNCLAHLGDFHFETGNYERSRAYSEDQLRLAERTEDPRLIASAAGDLGTVLQTLGDVSAARDLLSRQAEIARGIGKVSLESLALGRLGNLEFEQGDHRRARSRYEESLALAEEHELGTRRYYGGLGLGNVAYELGDLASATEWGERVLDWTQQTPGSRAELIALDLLTRSAIRQRDLARAERHFERGMSLVGELAATTLRLGAPGFPDAFTSWSEVDQDLLALQLGSDDAPERLARAFRNCGFWKSRRLLEGIVEHRVGGRTAESIGLVERRRDALSQLEQVMQTIASGVRDGMSPDEVDTWKARAGRLEAEALQLAADLREVSPRDAAIELPMGVDVTEVQAILDDDELLVEYASGEDRCYAYVLGARDATFLDLADRAEIEAAVAAYLALITDIERLGSVSDVASAGGRLFELLLRPVLRDRPGVRRLVVVPDTSLAGLPFGALVRGREVGPPSAAFADLAFVADELDVTYAPSSPVLLELAAGRRADRAVRALVLADPVYPEGEWEWSGTRALPPTREFRRLPRTKEEALAIARSVLHATDDGADDRAELSALETERSGSFSSDALELHLGSAVAPDKLDRDLRDFSILHFAMHGFVDHVEPNRTGLALSLKADEGYVTIADVLNLDLDAELVVLSACETGVGRVRKGEGVESLARAFLYAGSRSVVASLWQVSDWSSARTMEGFYERMLAGATPAAALRAAQQQIKDSGARFERARGDSLHAPATVAGQHPFFWAPFIFVGRGGDG